MTAAPSHEPSLRALFWIVILFAIPVTVSWVQKPPSPVAEAAPSERGPASVLGESSSESKPVGRFSRPLTLVWDLNAPALATEVSATHLRLRGQVKGLKMQAVTNQGNGFTAALFPLGEDFSTDFIELAEGTNQIEVELLDPQGKKITKTLQIQRRLPASNQNE